MVTVGRIVSLQDSSVSWIMEGLLGHFFSPYRPDYAIEDVRWLLKFANTQKQWCYLPTEMLEIKMGIVSGRAEDDLLCDYNSTQIEVRECLWYAYCHLPFPPEINCVLTIFMPVELL